MEGKRESDQTIEITHILTPYQPLLSGVSNFTLASQRSSPFFASKVSNWVEQNHVHTYPSWRSAKDGTDQLVAGAVHANRPVRYCKSMRVGGYWRKQGTL